MELTWESINLLFEIKDESLHQMDELMKILILSLDLLKKSYGDSEKTPEMKVQEVKQKVSWGRDFFKF